MLTDIIHRPFVHSVKAARLLYASRQASTSSSSDIEQAIAEWTGRLNAYRKVEKDIVAENVVSAVQATLEAPGISNSLEKGGVLPLAWNLFFFQPRFSMSQLREDGTEKEGNSPIAPPLITKTTERMWASGHFKWNANNPILLGDKLEQVTTIEKIERKKGREGRGDMFFIWQNKQISNERGESMSEKRCHVFRRPAEPGSTSAISKKLPQPKYAEADADFSAVWKTNPVLLFRYSALTFNSHRIHYDREYCVDIEGRPDLVVHGPMTSTKLVSLAHEHILKNAKEPRHLESVNYRATSPIYVGKDVKILGKWIEGDLESGGKLALWAINEQGTLCMEADAVVTR